MGLFDGYKPHMTDATVADPDNSESELVTVEPEEDVKAEEKDQVEFEESTATEALGLLKINKSRVRNVRAELVKKINKLARLHKGLVSDMAGHHGRLPQTLKVILMEEGVVDSEIISDSAEDDAKEAAKESEPSEIAEKGATEEELAKASLRAQHRAYMDIYNKLKML